VGMTRQMWDLITRNREGSAEALPSVCSTQPEVLAAALLLAREEGRLVLVEATSNQVNQFGGYTGMRPADFSERLSALAARLGVDRDQVLLGGDHLGPQVWRQERASVALERTREMVREYVRAGFCKIHLDCSEPCADDPRPLPPALCARRAADLAAECERSASNAGALAYVIGTEVPRPGGALEEEVLRPTRAEDAVEVIELHRKFFAQGAPQAWDRVAALVVQPGVEFSPAHVIHFDPTATQDLVEALNDYPRLCFEAHSTDYQRPEALSALGAAHFAILKVGPALTDAYRRALYRLDETNSALGTRGERSALRDVMEGLMLAEPGHWREHYRGTPAEESRLRHHSFADRVRYYWPQEPARRAVEALYQRIDALAPPPYVLRDFFGESLLERADGLRASAGGLARSLVLAGIQEVLRPYFRTSRL
jgi:D-tagatose-bisphosphate aldolase class II non-catalytic subunit